MDINKIINDIAKSENDINVSYKYDNILECYKTLCIKLISVIWILVGRIAHAFCYGAT